MGPLSSKVLSASNIIPTLRPTLPAILSEHPTSLSSLFLCPCPGHTTAVVVLHNLCCQQLRCRSCHQCLCETCSIAHQQISEAHRRGQPSMSLLRRENMMRNGIRRLWYARQPCGGRSHRYQYRRDLLRGEQLWASHMPVSVVVR